MKRTDPKWIVVFALSNLLCLGGSVFAEQSRIHQCLLAPVIKCGAGWTTEINW